MSAEEPPRAHLGVLAVIAVASCCALPVLVGIVAAFGTGVVLGAGVLLVAASTAAAVFSARWLGGRRVDHGRASAVVSERATRPEA